MQAPDAFRLIFAMELNRVSAPTVEASPIPKTLIATIASTRVNAATFLRRLIAGWAWRCPNFIFAIMVSSWYCRAKGTNYVPVGDPQDYGKLLTTTYAGIAMSSGNAAGYGTARFDATDGAIKIDQ